jgi:hypothetical protein
MNFLQKPIYTRDQPFFEFRVISLFFFTLFFTSNILLQFKSVSSIIGSVFVLFFPFILIFTGIYYYYKTFKLKQLNLFDVMIFTGAVFPLYNALTVHYIFDVKILKALFNQTGRMYVLMCSLIYYAIRSNKITLKQYTAANLFLCWFCLLLYTYVSLTINPATFKDSLGDGLVGYNPSKGGYLYRFSSAFLIYGMIYYFLRFILENKISGLIAWLILMSYQLFIDKGRTEFVSEIVPVILYMFFILKWHQIIKKLLTILLFVGVVVFIVYLIEPKLLVMTTDMYWVFLKFLMGNKTGEGSADMRWTEMAAVYNYLMRHPTYIFFGIGCPKQEIMQLQVGNIVLGDIGIVGGLLSQGIVGLIFIYSLFLFPIYVWRKVKYYKNNLYFNIGMLFSATTFIQSLFNGGIFYNLTGLAISLLILEYFRVKEKFYWKEQREKSLTDIQSTHTL